MSFEKKSWSSGNVVKKPYVVVDGVEYEVQPANVEGGDPITPEELNRIENGIEEASQTGGILTGSIVAYDGDTIPEGYEEVNDDTDWQYINQDYGVLYRKKGDLVMVRANSNFNGKLTGWANTVLGSLPLEARPNLSLRFPVYLKGNTNVYGEIIADTGEVKLFNWGNEISFESGQLAFYVMYFI